MAINSNYKNKFIKICNILKEYIQGSVVEEYDTLIFVGGGYTNQDFGLINLLKILYMEFLAKRNDIKVIFTGQTVGPYRILIYKLLIRKIYLMADRVYVRELYSKELLNKLGIDSKLTCDDAYLAYPNVDNAKKDTIIFNYKVFGKSELYRKRIFELFVKVAQISNCRCCIIPFRLDVESE